MVSGDGDVKSAVENVMSAVDSTTAEVKATADAGEAAAEAVDAGDDKKAPAPAPDGKPPVDIEAARAKVDEQFATERAAVNEDIGSLKDQQTNLREGAIAQETAIQAEEVAALEASDAGVKQAEERENAAHVAAADGEMAVSVQKEQHAQAQAEADDLQRQAEVEPKVTQAQVEAAEAATNEANSERHAAEQQSGNVKQEGVALAKEKAAAQANLGAKQKGKG